MHNLELIGKCLVYLSPSKIKKFKETREQSYLFFLTLCKLFQVALCMDVNVIMTTQYSTVLYMVLSHPHTSDNYSSLHIYTVSTLPPPSTHPLSYHTCSLDGRQKPVPT